MINHCVLIRSHWLDAVVYLSRYRHYGVLLVLLGHVPDFVMRASLQGKLGAVIVSLALSAVVNEFLIGTLGMGLLAVRGAHDAAFL